MATTSEARALPFFTDLQGLPLESGSIFIGQPGLDPQAYPQTVYSDAASTIALQQPVRTTHGHAVSGGAQVHLFCQVPYSIVVQDASGRTVYASLNEIDPIFTALSTSGVQSAADLPTLRARSGPSTNLVWVASFGMYRFISSDSTSPENVPFVIVGNDGSRYYLDLHTANLSIAKVSANEETSNYNSQGMWLSWNDLANGAGFITNNQGGGTGGVVIRNINAAANVETGRVTIGGNGSITASAGITTTAGDIRSAGNLIASGGIVSVTSDGTRSLQWDGTKYNLALADLFVNGSKALTQANYQASILANQQANGVGAVALGSSSGVNPPTLPGTWVQTGSNFNTVFQYVRVV